MKQALAAMLALSLLAGCKPAETQTTDPPTDKTSTTGPSAAATTGATTGANPITTTGATTGTNPLVNQGTMPTTPSIENSTGTASAADMKKFVAKYDGKIMFTKENIAAMKAMAPPAQQAEVDKSIEESKHVVITLDLKADGTYSAITTVKTKTQTEKGKWAYDAANNAVVFKDPDISPEQIAKMKAGGATDQMIENARKQTQTLVASKDGKTLTLSNGQGPLAVNIVFTRK